jgi:ribulose-5-phosphate 4-epimerase/fuculose-1-phosphate aldolase
VGQTVDAAAWWFIAMDRSCQAQLLAMAAGTPVTLDHPNAKLTHSQVGSEIGGWFSFQPMFDWIVAKEPDLLD